MVGRPEVIAQVLTNALAGKVGSNVEVTSDLTSQGSRQTIAAVTS
jgi:hypothetical protein